MRLFVAVWPDGPTRDRLGCLPLPVPGLRPVRPGSWHVTLRYLGEVDGREVPVLARALESAAATVDGPVPCVVGPATAWFPGRRVLQIPVAGLEALARAVRSTTAVVVPAGGDDTGFAGHLTVARRYGRRAGSAAPPPDADPAGIPFAAVFTAGAIDLVESRPAGGGPRYVTVERVGLGPARWVPGPEPA